MLEGVAFTQSLLVLRLSVLLDPGLQLDAQMAAVAQEAYYQLRWVRQLSRFLDKRDFATVTYAVATTRVNCKQTGNYNWYRMLQPRCC